MILWCPTLHVGFYCVSAVLGFGGAYTLMPVNMNSGGTRSEAGAYSITASTAQHGGVETIASEHYTLNDGFWFAAVPPEECTTDAGCAPDQFCEDGVCKCLNDNGCVAGQHCDPTDHECKKCLIEQDCPPGRRCDQNKGECVECLRDAHCSTGQTCNDGTCGCLDDQACPLGQICDDSTCKCVAQTGCPPEQLCDLGDGRCKDCLTNNNCEPDETCRMPDGVCVRPCETNDWCVGPGIDTDPCTFDRCMPPCTHEDAKLGDVCGEKGSCGPDGEVSLLDILCILDGFQGIFEPHPPCTRGNFDIAGTEGSCAPDELIDLNDILMVLDAFQGNDRCCFDGR